MSCSVLEVAMPGNLGGRDVVRSCSWHVTKEAGLGLCKSSARRCVFARKVIVGVRATGPGDS